MKFECVSVSIAVIVAKLTFYDYCTVFYFIAAGNKEFWLCWRFGNVRNLQVNANAGN